MWAIVGTKSAVSKMKWVKVQLQSFLSTALPSHAFALRHFWNQECTQNMMLIFLSTVQFVSWTPLKVDAFKVRQKLGFCLTLEASTSHNCPVNLQKAYLRVLKKAFIHVWKFSIQGVGPSLFYSPMNSKLIFFGGLFGLGGHRLYPSQISVRYRINESGRLNIFNLNNPFATTLSASNGWKGGGRILVFLLPEGMAAPLIPCHPAYCTYSGYLLLNELVMLTTSERPCFTLR